MKNTILYVGIDPSINSTGITIINYNSKIVDIQFYIIKPNKLTKKESDIENYLMYQSKSLPLVQIESHQLGWERPQR